MIKLLSKSKQTIYAFLSNVTYTFAIWFIAVLINHYYGAETLGEFSFIQAIIAPLALFFHLQLKTLATLEATKKTLDRKVRIIEELKSRQKKTVKMMDQLSQAIPEWVWLTKMTYSGTQLNLSGKALSNNLIADFISSLKGTNHFGNIQLIRSVRKQESGLDIFSFSLKCSYIDIIKKVV